MRLNNFSVRIPQGSEDGSAYVEMKHGKQYTLILGNKDYQQCKAYVEIDGKHVGTWLIDANTTVTLERPAHDTGKFTFYKIGTDGARKAGLQDGDPNNGLVKVTFTPVITVPGPVITTTTEGTGGPVWWKYRPDIVSGGFVNATPPGPEILDHKLSNYGASTSQGGTGLSGDSNQTFQENTDTIIADYTKQTVIHLRLVAREDVNEPRPLTSYSNPVPPPVQ